MVSSSTLIPDIFSSLIYLSNFVALSSSTLVAIVSLEEFLLSFDNTSSLFNSKHSAILPAISSFLSLSTLFGTAVTIFTEMLCAKIFSPVAS